MKKSLFIFVALMCLTSCSNTYYSDDFERYVEVYHNSNFGTDDPQYLLPSMTFIKDYEYLDGGYHWKLYEESSGFNSLERVILNLTYDTNVYGEAKKFALDNCDFDSTIYTYNNYIFRENLALPYAYETFENGKNQWFPYHSTMFGYNDEKNVLIFTGFRCGKNHYEEADVAKTDWGAFLKTYYSKFYDFDA